MFLSYDIWHSEIVNHLRIDNLFSSLFSYVYHSLSSKTLDSIVELSKFPCTLIVAFVINYCYNLPMYLYFIPLPLYSPLYDYLSRIYLRVCFFFLCICFSVKILYVLKHNLGQLHSRRRRDARGWSFQGEETKISVVFLQDFSCWNHLEFFAKKDFNMVYRSVTKFITYILNAGPFYKN